MARVHDDRANTLEQKRSSHIGRQECSFEIQTVHSRYSTKIFRYMKNKTSLG